MALWTKEQDQTIREMWAAGEKTAVIAATLGKTDDQIRWRRETLKLTPRRMGCGTVFTDEMIETIIRLWRAGYTARDIGEAVGLSETSINCKVRRLRKKYPGRLAFRCVRKEKQNSDIDFMTSIAEVQRIVAKSFTIPPRALTSKCQLGALIEPRFIAMAISRRLTCASLKVIAGAFNRKDHTTIINGIRKAEARWPEKIAELESRIVGMKEAAE